MILLQFPVSDDISDSDPVFVRLEYDPANERCWLDVRRLNVRIGGIGGDALAAYWDSGWVRRCLNKGSGDPNFTDKPMSSVELVGAMAHRLRAFHGQLPLEELGDALDEARVGPMARALEVMES